MVDRTLIKVSSNDGAHVSAYSEPVLVRRGQLTGIDHSRPTGADLQLGLADRNPRWKPKPKKPKKPKKH